MDILNIRYGDSFVRKDKKVSIIIPVYNVAKYLAAAIESTVSQTYENVEVILVDDGSTDGCSSICDDWADKNEKIKVVHKENGGLSSARNAGLDIAQGDYIYFLDGDDYISPDLVRTVVLYMNLGYDMVVFQHYAVHDDGKKELRTCSLGEYIIDGTDVRKDYYIKTLLQYHIGWEAWNRMFRRDIIEALHLRYEDNRKIFAEDLYFIMCYSLTVRSIASIDSAFYYYRLRDDSIMGKENGKLNIGRMNEMSKAIYEFFKSHNAPAGLIELYPVMHYIIMQGCAMRYKNIKGINEIQLRRIIMEDVSDKKFFRMLLRKLTQQQKPWKKYFSTEEAMHIVKIANYWRTGSFAYFTIKTEEIRAYQKIIRRKDRKYLELPPHEGRKIYFIGSETYGNLGDGMIAESIIEFCKHCLPEYGIEEYPLSSYWTQKRYLVSAIQPDDIIVMTGGGNFGNKYPVAQMVKQDVVKTWVQNKKIIFPQTVFYLEGADDSLNEDKELFSKDNNVILFTRDQKSYDFARENFTCTLGLAPDIVLFRKMQKKTEREKKILLLLRGDSERSFSHGDLEYVINKACATGMNVCASDLQLIYNGAEISLRKKEINRKLDLISSSKFVITDRLHGMVFAAVTGTPCLVFPNFNFKVKGTYEWLSYLPYIKFADSIDQVDAYMEELLGFSECSYDNEPLLPYYKKLADTLKN